MAHTPGPWKVLGGTIIENNNEDELIATVPEGFEDSARFDRTRANATLIAAAPELLEALIDVTQELTTEIVRNQHCSYEIAQERGSIKRARTIISKVKGYT
jgi:hypothetical protein